MNKRWYTEEQVCDAMLLNSSLIKECLDVEGAEFYRERNIAHKLRPDFTLISDNAYNIIEVKLNADLDSIWQIINYVWVCNSHIRNAPRSFNSNLGIRFNGHLFAKTFDKGVYSIAAESNIKLWRYKISERNEPNKSIFSFEEEPHPFEEALDGSFLLELKKHFN